MARMLYVGNLGFEATGSELRRLFAPHGIVTSARVVHDRGSGRSKGFGFVEMKTDEQGLAAIAALNGQMAGGRALVVNEARPGTGRGLARHF